MTFSSVNAATGVRVIATKFWIGVEHLSVDALLQAAAHPAPIFCGHLGACEAARQAVAIASRSPDWPGGNTEWHDARTSTTIGRGLVLDLLRQRGPIEEIILVLPTWEWGSGREGERHPVSAEWSDIREVLDGLLAVARGAAAVLEASRGAGMTVLAPQNHPQPHAVQAGLSAFVEQFVAVESQKWIARGLFLRLDRHP